MEFLRNVAWLNAEEKENVLVGKPGDRTVELDHAYWSGYIDSLDHMLKKISDEEARDEIA